MTRPADQTASLRAAFAEVGWDVLCQAAIVIRQPASWTRVDDVIAAHDSFDWILFSSVSGVQWFGERWQEVSPVTFPPPHKIGAVGRETARSVETLWRRPVNVCPETATAAALAAALNAEAQRRQRFLSVRGSRGGDALASGLVAAGGVVTEVAVYESVDVSPNEIDPRVDAMMRSKKIDAVTVTSSAIAESLVRLWGEHLRATRLIAIGPVTAATLAALGFPASAVAETANAAGIVAATMRCV
ncbi:MAG: uroporphyrinogen-III synthase [Thermoguttaceae bacterium]